MLGKAKRRVPRFTSENSNSAQFVIGRENILQD